MNSADLKRGCRQRIRRPDVEIFKPKGGNLFRRLRADGSEADEVRFERDKAGHPYRFVEFSNPHDRLAELSSTPQQKE